MRKSLRVCLALAAGGVLLPSSALARARTSIPELGDCQLTEDQNPAEAQSLPAITPQGEGRALRLMSSYLLEGHCARLAKQFQAGTIFFANGKRATIREKGVVSVDSVPNVTLAEVTSDRRPSGAPKFHGDSLSAAYGVSQNGNKPDPILDYAGVWSKRRQDTIASFSVEAGKPVGLVEPMLRSPRPITAISYFPALTADPVGSLSLIQRLGSRKLRLLTYTWDHPNLASRKFLKTPIIQGMTIEQANLLIRKMQDLQAKLRAGEKPYFELMSGANASLPSASISPREAFLQMQFDKAWMIDKRRTTNRLWQPVNFVFRSPDQPRLIWEVEVALGSDDQVQRVQLIHKQPAPF